jgi:hypothetical protein
VTFALDLKKFADKTDARVNALVRKIVIDVGTSVVLKSPVGDANYWKSPAPPGYVGGRFRGNWQYGLGAINPVTSEAIDPSGATTISSIVGKVDDTPAGQVHYITNSLPYADRLENGWSRQAPNGMVNLTALEFQPIVDAAAKAIS